MKRNFIPATSPRIATANSVAFLPWLISLLILGGTISCTAVADNALLLPTPEMAQYRLQDLRTEKDRFGRDVLAVDWRRTRAGKGHPRLSGKTKTGDIQITAFGGLPGDSGTAKIQIIGVGFGSRNNHYELWVESGGLGGQRFMISNAVRLGNPGPATRARAMNAQEKAAWKDRRIRNTPPKSLPADHGPVGGDVRLIPGMMIKAGWKGGWEDAEVLAVDGTSTVTVRYRNQGNQIFIRPRQDWLAISLDTIDQASAAAKKFKPSVRVLPGSTVVIPDDVKLLVDVSPQPVGLPVRYVYAGSLHDGFVAGFQGNMVNIRRVSGNSRQDRKVKRSQVVVTPEVVAKLGDSAAVRAFADNVRVQISQTASLPLKDYPVKKDPPPGYTKLTPDALVKANTMVKGCWGSRWYDLTVLADSRSGPVPIRWDSFGAVWDCRIAREQLVISRSDLAAAGAVKTEGELRTWSDRTGKFNIQARFVSLNDGTVKLENRSGKEIKISLRKLSASDQAFAQKQKKRSDANPFKFVE